MRTLAPLLLVATLASAQVLTDDFSGYADAAALETAWHSDLLALTWQDEAMRIDDGIALWQAAPYASQASLSATITIREAFGQRTGWSVGGLGFGRDNDNFWALQVVQGPGADGDPDGVRPFFVEMAELREGVWQAESKEGTRLPRLVYESLGTWAVDQPLRFELDWSPTRVEGRILAEGQLLGRWAFDVSAPLPALRDGRPLVRAAGLEVDVDDVTYDVAATAPEPPPAERPAPPAWVSREGEAIVPGTGFFRALQQDGRWWVVDPEGKPYYILGTDHIRYIGHWSEALSYAPYALVSAAKYGTEDRWAEAAVERLLSWNFNTAAAGHSQSVRHRGLTHILFASFGSQFASRSWIAEPIHWTGFPDVFDPRWERWCRVRAGQMADEMRDDPWCLGVFLDNELEWFGKTGHLVDDVYRLAPEGPAKQALWDWLIAHYGDLAAVNRALGTSHADRDAFLADVAPPRGPEYELVRNEFLKVIADRYFRLPFEALRAADPDHMVWGTRFAGRVPAEVLPPAGEFTDIFTINTYPRVDMAGRRVIDTPRMLNEYYEVVQRPMVITEWSFPALDTELPSRHGAGMRVDTQEQKALCYEIFANQMADLPYMVGYHYFMYLDEPKEGISPTFPEDSNYGLINVNDEVYVELTETATRVNAGAAERHARSAWRDFPQETDSWLPAGAAVELVNRGQTEVVGQFAALDGAQPGAGRIRTLAPGAAWTPPARPAGRPVDEIVLRTAGTTWSMALGAGPLVRAVVADGLALGSVSAAAHQIVGGAAAWSRANRVESMMAFDLPEATMVDAVVSYQTPTGASYRAGVRLIGVDDEPVLLIRPLWYENLSDRPWTLWSAFIFCDPAIGGDGTDDVPGGPAVPNYYRQLGAYTDPALGGAFGAFGPQGGWHVSFSDFDGMHHPDATFGVEQAIPAGERIELVQGPYLLAFGVTGADDWRELSQRWLPLGQLQIAAP